MKVKLFLFSLLIFIFGRSSGQTVVVRSPNEKNIVKLFNQQNSASGEWYMQVSYNDSGRITEAIARIDIGLSRSDQEFSKELKFLKASRPSLINEEYQALHGKKSVCRNTANEIIIFFENPSKEAFNLIVRAYNDGVTFRYEFPGKQGSFVIKDELTSYTIPLTTTRWMEKWNTSNEGLYTAITSSKIPSGEWGYPALFNAGNSGCWFLLHESDVNKNYCGTKLSNRSDSSRYKLTFPDARDGNGLGAVTPAIELPWKSPWRVITMGTLSDIVESTLVNDVAPPSVIKNTDWIKPGIASWNYWSENHGTRNYKTVCEFADLAADMGWPYTLLDWEWDAMGNGGNLEDAVKYIHSKGVKPLIWYNSGGPHTGVRATPRDRMLAHQNRVEEFTKLKSMGFAGVKVDFFDSEKQDMINYYWGILEDAAAFQMMVYFHGCIVPRGWERTYPNLMTYEAVRGAEWYNNTPDFTLPAPEHNATLPFTRNVVGSMDYTPVTFTNSQYPHITSYGHELALSVLFESGIQHMADRPDGYNTLPDAARTFLKNVPNAWDDTKLLDGYPGKDVIIARCKKEEWYIGGVNGEQKEKTKKIKFTFLKKGVKYRLTLISDGQHDKDFKTQHLVVDTDSTVEVKLLRRGGFAASLVPLP